MFAERLLAVFERVLAAFASLKLAIFTISGLAFYLAVATVYESVYGAPAAQAVVYGSTAFFVIMILLATNVAAAVIVRYPFKRRQTGFVITHIGIELLLLGCLISYYRSNEGVVAMRPGQTVDAIESIKEGVFVSWGENGRVRQEALPLECWEEAGYPSVGRFVAGAVKPLPEEPRWTGPAMSKSLAPGVKLEVLDWLAAAKSDRRAVDDEHGSPAALVRLNGQTPNGMAQDERVWLHQPDSNGAAAALFGGTIEAVLWQAKTPGDVDAFLHPPAAAELPEAGRLTVRVGDASARIDVSTQLNQAIPVGNGGWRATATEYFPEAKWDGSKLAKAGDAPVDPMARVRLNGPAGEAVEWVAAARYPFLSGPLGGTPAAAIGVTYDHPAVYVTDKNGQRGRLHLLQAADGKLYSRRFGLKGLMDAPAEVKIGEESGGFMGLKMSVVEHRRSAVIQDGFVPLRAAPAKMADAMRATKVALTVDGVRKEAWLARGAGPMRLDTPRGPISVAYGFDALRLPFRMELKNATMTRDPGSANAAAYQSDVETIGDDDSRTPHKITMNEPAEVAGMTFYQSGFDENSPGGVVTVLRMRQDAGRWAKYGGCALITFGIFVMFYMKAYFQKPATAKTKSATAKPTKLAAATA